MSNSRGGPATAFKDLCQEFADVRGVPLLVLARSQLRDRDVRQAAALLKGKKQLPRLDLLIVDCVGGTHVALNLLRMLEKHSEHLTACVPSRAQSAGTQLALGCNELLMGELGFLGPLDTQIRTWNFELRKVDRKSTLELNEAVTQLKYLMADQVDAVFARIDNALMQSQEVRLETSTILSMAADLIMKTLEPLLSALNPESLLEHQRALEENVEYAKLVIGRGHPDLSTEDVTRIIDQLGKRFNDHWFAIPLRDVQLTGVEAALMPPEVNVIALEIAHAAAGAQVDLVDLLQPRTGS